MQELLTHWKDILIAFCISMAPVLELRGGIIYAAARSVPFPLAAAVCYLGTVLPIPFVLLFLRRALAFLARFRRTQGLARRLTMHAHKQGAKRQTATLLGLFLFVAIPLPGTGAWSGALVAVVLGIPLRKALPAIALGALGALLIMITLSYWIPGLFFSFS